MKLQDENTYIAIQTALLVGSIICIMLAGCCLFKALLL